jgi:hypothetical protein
VSVRALVVGRASDLACILSIAFCTAFDPVSSPDLAVAPNIFFMMAFT